MTCLGLRLKISPGGQKLTAKIDPQPVRVLLRHSVVVASPKRIVINHTQLFTIRFGTSVPKSKSGSYISLFVLELPSLPNRKAEVIFHYSFWNFRSQIEKRKLICHNLFWNKSKNRALFVLELALQIEERTLKQKLDSQFDAELGLEVEKTNVTSP